jgi:hypothetical protein
MPHIILLLLVTRKDSDFLEIIYEPVQDCMTERPRTAGNQKNFIIKHFYFPSLDLF